MSNSISNHVRVNRANYSSALYLTADSGKIIYRDKVDTIIGIKHPGIILGTDAWGTDWAIHNHYQIGFPQIVTLEEFSQGARVFHDDRPTFYDKAQIIERAISHWIERKEYGWLRHNCQQFVNKIAHNSNHSEAIDSVSDGAMLLGGTISLIGLVTGNGSAVKIGLSIAGAGAAGKVLSR
jgi:hypothetical protein